MHRLQMLLFEVKSYSHWSQFAGQAWQALFTSTNPGMHEKHWELSLAQVAHLPNSALLVSGLIEAQSWRAPVLSKYYPNGATLALLEEAVVLTIAGLFSHVEVFSFKIKPSSLLQTHFLLIASYAASFGQFRLATEKSEDF